MKRFFVVLLAFSALATQAQAASYRCEAQDIVIDVRTPAEFAAGHVGGAVNMPLDRLVPDIRARTELHQDSRILVYCATGRRSAAAHLQLQKLGYRKVQDGGGFAALQQSLKSCPPGTVR
jgi:phage shock protein E